MSTPDELHEQIEQFKRDLTFELQRRERPDRHPYQVGCLVGLLIVSLAQALLGIPPESALFNVVDYTTLLAIDSVFIVGSVLCLWGAALSRTEHFTMSVRFGIWGHFAVFFGCMTYTTIVIATTQPDFDSRPYWLSITSVGLSLGVAYASVMRFKQMYALLKDWKARNPKGRR